MRFRSVRSKLHLAFLGALILPLTALTVYYVLYFGHKIEQEARDRIHTEAHMATLILDQQGRRLAFLVENLASKKSWTILLQLGLFKELSRRLYRAAAAIGIDSIIVVDKAGRALAGSSWGHAPRWALLPESFIDGALEGKQMAGFDLTPAQGSACQRCGVLCLKATAPIYNLNHDSIIGILGVCQVLNHKASLVEKIREVVRADVYLYAGEELVATNVSDRRAAPFRVMPKGVVDRVLVKGQEGSEAKVYSGGYLAAYVPLADTNGRPLAVLMVSIDAGPYVRTRRTATVVALGVGALAVALILLVMMLIERGVLEPIRELTDGIMIVAQGEYGHRLDVKSSDEIGFLTSSFNEMASSLEGARKQAQDYGRELERYREQLEDMVRLRTQELRYLVQLQRLLATISTRFIQMPSAHVDRGIEESLKAVGEFTGMDRAYVVQFGEAVTRFRCVHEWTFASVEARHRQEKGLKAGSEWRRVLERMKRGEVVYASDSQGEGSAGEKADDFLERLGVKSFLAIPLSGGDHVLGFWALEAIGKAVHFDSEVIGLLNVVGQTFAGVLKRKQMEDAVRQSEARYRAIVEDQTELIFRCRPSGRITFVNQALCRYFKRTREELLGYNAFMLVCPDDRFFARRYLQGVGRLYPVTSLECRMITDGPAERWCRWTVREISRTGEGREAELQGVGRDMSEQKKALEALRLSEARFRATFQQSAVGMSVMALDGRIIETNAALERMLGYRRGELSGVQMRSLLHAEDAERFFATIAGITGGEREWGHVEKRYRRRDGSLIWTQVSLSLIRGETGTREFFILMIQDITRRREAERQIQESLREKEILLREIHHRVKNNLQIISGLLDLARRRGGSGTTSDLLDDACSRIHAMSLIHTQLYHDERLDAIDMGKHVRRLVQHLSRTYVHGNQKIAVDVDKTRLVLDVNQAIPCALVINELVSNSFKHAFVGRREGRIRVTLSEERTGRVRVEVTDDGIGMDKKELTGQPPTLGMQLVTNLVRHQLRGRVDVDGVVGTRTIVTFQRTVSEEQDGEGADSR